MQIEAEHNISQVQIEVEFNVSQVQIEAELNVSQVQIELPMYQNRSLFFESKVWINLDIFQIS